jgi:glycosyltransferase involved in cell wall biosynthesis
MIRVLALLPYPLGHVPGQRFRIEQWAPLLGAEDVEVSFLPFLSAEDMGVLYQRGFVSRKVAAILRGYALRISTIVGRPSADVVLVFREAALLGGPWIERVMSWRAPVVFDFDDAIYMADTSRVNAWSRILKSRNKTEAICRLAGHVTVGNELLAEFARKHAAAVTVVPTTINTDLYNVQPRAMNLRPVVGWSGSRTTLPYLTTLGPALQRLHERLEFELCVIGGETRIEGMPVHCKPWRANTEVDDLRSFDVGLMPLPNDEWSRGKCGLKALQYMALGIPPVVSPVGVNTTIVRDGINGFHARNEEEWVDRIALLLSDESLRHRMGIEARRTVEQSYSHRVHAPRVARVLREAAG